MTVTVIFFFCNQFIYVHLQLCKVKLHRVHAPGHRAGRGVTPQRRPFILTFGKPELDSSSLVSLSSAEEQSKSVSDSA